MRAGRILETLAASRLGRYLLLGVLFAIPMLLASLSASTQEPPSLRKDIQNLRSLLGEYGADIVGPPYPQLPSGLPFDKISPSIVGIQELGRHAIADVDVDGPALLDFAQRSIQARLRELNLWPKITVVPPGSFDWWHDYPCDTLRATFLIRTFDRELDGSKAVATVINLITWEGVAFQGTDGSTQCQERPVPPLGGLDGTKFFTATTREEAMVKSRDAILALVDTEILRRLLRTNGDARNLVRAWVE